ncbi:PREDICTED: zinc finger protein CONSTANS-LIKE 9-like [Tarenaya hassleriana]|uniref:zinc finger protein CONSTANS-LIKE 9-like n=1 Tax=Tarenaya hassleriana TaxID=28532 RepID=UPI0008FD335E|nr:PREDICTED: zinc finger protein CONSTANS-LIKE 9-like [Tarenaya hassleriana]
MGYMCDFCGEQRSMVYCRSDAACLCLSCDRNVHSANVLSKRHSRTLVCERCNSQPASVRCTDERVSLCQNCDWSGHVPSNPSASHHQRQTINCYSGCPSSAELGSFWSFVSDNSSPGQSECEQEMGLMSIADDGPRENFTAQDVLAGSSSVHETGSRRNCAAKNIWWLALSLWHLQYFFGPPRNLLLLKLKTRLSCGWLKGLGVCDEVDLDLENYEQLFGVAFNPPRRAL